MRKTKEDSVSNNLIRFLEQYPDGTLFNYKDFESCGTYTAIRTAVVKLCQWNLLVRLCQGVYIKPSASGKYEVPDDITLAIEIDRRNGSIASPKGHTLDYLNGKLPEMPNLLEFYSTGSGRSIQLPDGRIVKYTFIR